MLRWGDNFLGSVDDFWKGVFLSLLWVQSIEVVVEEMVQQQKRDNSSVDSSDSTLKHEIGEELSLLFGALMGE